MALFEEASPICRGKNLSWETILLFYNNMPREAMPRAKFHAYTERRINGWTTTHSQIARQLAFYYEENGVCFPRFTKEISYTDLFKYMQNWAAKYFIPNPYSPSLKGKKPTSVYKYILSAIESGKTNFDEILDSMFGIKLSSHDKVRVFINNFTDLIIDNNKVSKNIRTFGSKSTLYPDEIYATDQKSYYDYFNTKAEIVSNNYRINNERLPLQQIFYGAPGTGKSNTIKCEVDEKGKKCFRTTFHPDSDYSTFVGCYKPSMKPTGVTLASKEKEEVITYKFIPQAFTRAYVEAWNTDEDVFLVIEEINRGNCAQIFGDLFQLLDRKDGVSEYPVEADTDLAAYLSEALAKSEREDIPEEVKSGEKLMLPSNLYIWATMNTSDQSLFPIDSAFKRRWDWKYIPIDTRKEQWNIVAEGVSYSWASFLDIVNERVLKATSSEDKQLGFYFCKAQNNVVSAETFVSKVLFYLWNDVFKDYEEGESIFRDTTGALLPFSKFYHTDGSVNNAVVKELLTALDVETTTGTDTNDNPISETEEEDDDGNTTASAGKNYDKFSVNGEGKYGKNRLATESVRKYIELHPELTAEEVLRNWKNLRVNVPHFIESKEEYESRTDNSIRSYSIPCGDTIIYVAHNGYGSNGKVYELISAVNAQDWGLTLAKVAK